MQTDWEKLLAGPLVEKWRKVAHEWPDKTPTGKAFSQGLLSAANQLLAHLRESGLVELLEAGQAMWDKVDSYGELGRTKEWEDWLAAKAKLLGKGVDANEYWPRSKATVAHVVGQAGKCWCGVTHADWKAPERNLTEHQKNVEKAAGMPIDWSMANAAQAAAPKVPMDILRCQESHAEGGQCELREGHIGKHLAGMIMWAAKLLGKG